jgi:hypothetical protein
VNTLAEPTRLCEPCYAGVSDSHCATCGQIIALGGLIALDRRYHNEHFVCTTCFLPLNEGFFEYQGQPYCRVVRLQPSHTTRACPVRAKV